MKEDCLKSMLLIKKEERKNKKDIVGRHKERSHVNNILRTFNF